MRSSKLALAFGVLVSGACIVVVPLIIMPEASRSEYFWYRIAWTEFLSLILWGVWGQPIHKIQHESGRSRGLGGIWHVLGGVALVYAFVSFVMMVIHAWIPVSASIDKLHIVGQIILLTGALLLSVFLSSARDLSKPTDEHSADDCKSPPELISLLKMQEEKLQTGSLAEERSEKTKVLFQKIKFLRERLMFSLQHFGAALTNPDYRELSQRIEGMIAHLNGVDQDMPASEGSFAGVQAEIDDLIRRVEFVSNRMKKTS